MKSKPLTELRAIVGSALNLLSPRNDTALYPHRNWRCRETGVVVWIGHDVPVTIALDHGADPRVVFSTEEGRRVQVYISMTLQEFIARFEPVEEVTDWQPLAVKKPAA